MILLFHNLSASFVEYYNRSQQHYLPFVMFLSFPTILLLLFSFYRNFLKEEQIEKLESAFWFLILGVLDLDAY